MPQFTYVSRNPQGQKVTAIAEAETRISLIGRLKEKGLTVIEVQEIGEEARPSVKERLVSLKRLAGLSPIRLSDMAIFWRELSTMVAAGLPVVEALESIIEELEHVRLRRVLSKVIANMWEGMNFSQSISRHPTIFPPMVIALIGASEESGSLPQVATQLADFLENRDRVFRKVRAALTYPIFVCVFFLFIMGVATFWLIPKFRAIYSGFNAKLPLLTEAVFSINSFILAYLPWLVVTTILALAAGLMWLRKPSGRIFRDTLVLKLPLFGKLLQKVAVSRFCRSLSILLAGGIPINRAMELAQETAGNIVVAKAIANSREEILKGSRIAASLKKQKIFPHMVVRMVSAGEETGSLSSLLEQVADFYEARVDSALATINSLIEPALIVVIGGFVLIFVLALYMPIFSLASTVRG